MAPSAPVCDQPIYVVYQMGKVGSSTVYESLRRAGVPRVHKVHYLTAEGLDRARRSYQGFSVRVPVPHEATSMMLRTILSAGSPDVRWKVITLVREPIARDVSAYVQMVDLLNPELVAGASPQVSRIARAAAAQFVGFDENRSYTCRWFDDEFARTFGVDVLARPFEHGRGWGRITQDNVDVLVLRMEDLDRVFETAMLDFSGRRVPAIYQSARSPQKLQAAYRKDVYQQILDQARISEQSCRAVYQSRYARHFYSQDELAGFQERWSGERIPEGDRPWRSH